MLILTVLVMIALLGLFALPWTGKREPTVRGMSLTQWLESANQNNLGDGLAELGPAAIPFLIEKAGARESALKSMYLELLHGLSAGTRRHLPSVQHTELIGRNALLGLQEFGEEATSTLPAILEIATNHPDPVTRSRALRAALAVGWNELSVKTLFKNLLNDPRTRPQAALAIYSVGYAPPGLASSLIPLDLSGTNHPPLNEILALSVFGPEAAAAVPDLITGLADPRFARVNNLEIALAKIGPRAAPAIPALLDRLKKVGTPAKTHIVEAFMNMGPAAKTTLPELRLLLRDKDSTIRELAAAAIMKIGGPTEATVPVLVRCLTNSSSGNCYWSFPLRLHGLDHYALDSQMTAAWLLGELGPDSNSALPALKEIATGNHPDWLKTMAARAIWRLSREAGLDFVVPVLRESLKSKHNETRVIACVTLADMGNAAKPLIPDLEAACKLSLNTRRAAREAISRIRGTMEPAGSPTP